MTGTLIFLDIDGTLVAPGETAPPASAQEAIRRAQAAGNRVFLCSGRNVRMLEPLLAYGFDGFIASSGGYVSIDGHVLFDQPMTEAQRERALSVLGKAGVARIAESNSVAFADDRYLEYLREKLPGGASSELSRWRAQLQQDLGIRPMTEYSGQPLYKIVLLSDGRERLEQSYASLKQDFALVIQDCDERGMVNAELLPKTFDKGRGIRQVCTQFGVIPERCFGYGDSMNDRELLETVGHGVAMEHACEALKAMADEICPAVEEDGLFRSFQKNGLF